MLGELLWGTTLNVLFFGVRCIGYPDLNHQFPALSSLVIAFLLVLPMGAWMHFRGMDWSHTLEMTASPIVLGILLIGLAWLCIISTSSLIEWLTRLACPFMLIPMLLRLDLYTGSMGGPGLWLGRSWPSSPVESRKVLGADLACFLNF